MIWECESTLVIMLTTIVERGRIKCHKYWPDIGATSEFGQLEVTCIKEDTGDNFVFREFSILLKETDEVRQVTQMAYLSWPDHGVPESSQEFVDFVEAVRSHRQGSLASTIGKEIKGYFFVENNFVKGSFISIQLVPKRHTCNFLPPCNKKFA